MDVLLVIDSVTNNVLRPNGGAYVEELEEARAAIAELIEADKEFDAAHRDWEHVTAHDPQETSDEDWKRIADRFEAATMRRIAAIARVGGA